MGCDRPAILSQFPFIPRGKDTIIGYCGFFYHPEHGIEDIEIGYRLNPDYWNRGLITEAARTVRDHGFRDRNLSRVISLIHPENLPSRRVAEKNGMKIEKKITFRGFPTLVFAMTREEWLAQHGAGGTRVRAHDKPARPLRLERTPGWSPQSSAPRRTGRCRG